MSHVVLNRVIVGDCREVLVTLPESSFQCCVTSPPYWGLRDYGVDGQLGLEAKPEEYIANMVDVFRGVRRVLRDDGTLWLNIGDSYCSSGGSGAQGKNGQMAGRAVTTSRGDGLPKRNGRGETMRTRADRDPKHAGKHTAIGAMTQPNRVPLTGLKPKDLVGIPWMLAFALRADGWWLRSDIVWHKPNPMPEAVTDRPTKAHEYVFLLAKSQHYFYDAEAVREQVSPDTHSRGRRGTGRKQAGTPMTSGVGRVKANADFAAAIGDGIVTERNARSVWTIPSSPYGGAHFATFPPKLAERCILAGSKLGSAVIDPFMGSGTVGQVAEALGRKWLGIEINPKYAELAGDRTAQAGLPWELLP